MLEWQWWGIGFRISLWFPLMVLAMLTQDPSGMAAGCLCAAVLHEIGHFLAMLAVGDRPTRICLGVFGVRAEHNAVPLSYEKAAIISLAGPLTNVLCALVFQRMGAAQAALIHSVLAGFHLLPIAAVDGGEALQLLLSLAMEEEQAHRAVLRISVGILFPLAAIGFFLLIQTGYNLSLLVLTLYLSCLLIFKEKH